jgi:CNT family concentrative nucleoside transporter
MILQSAAGIVGIIALAWIMSENRPRACLKTTAWSVGLQFLLALIFLKLPPVKSVFLEFNRVILALQEATLAGTGFVFGYVGGKDIPFLESGAGSSFIFAFQAMPLILVISALSALLFHWRVLPAVVQGFSKVLQKSLRLGGAVGVAAAANVFMGMMEAPILVRPYLVVLKRAELFMIMVCGMATIAGTMMVLYAGILTPVLPGALGHLLTASIINLPAAIAIARLMVPETEPPTLGSLEITAEDRNAMDAIVRGTLNGVQLLINIIALLIVLVALVSLANQILDLLPHVGGAAITLQRLFGVLLSPLALAMGVPWAEVHVAGSLLGTKVVLNELIAYVELTHLPEGALSERSRVIMIYSLCGFANFGSLGIMIGGMGVLAPERRDEIIALGLKSIAAGTLATCLTGAVIGTIL